MVTLIEAGFVVAGVALLFAGAALSIYGVGGLGLLLGGGGGYFVAPTIGDILGLSGLPATAAAVLVGAVAGVAVTYVLLSVAVAAISFVVGAYLGLVLADPVVGTDGLIMTIGVVLGVGIASAFLGMFLMRTSMIIITSFIGAALASQSITFEKLGTVQTDVTINPLLFDPTDPLFLGLVAFGVLSQFGLFRLGYVTKLVSWLPGASVLSDEKSSGS